MGFPSTWQPRPLKIGKTNDNQRYLAQVFPIVPAFRQNACVDGAQFPDTLTVVLKNPQVGHKVRVQDFDGWSGEAGTWPRDTIQCALITLGGATMENPITCKLFPHKVS